MKKIFLILSLFPLLLLANFSEVQALYEKGAYGDAVRAARHSIEDFPNPKLHLLWAKSALKEGDLNQAMAAYERVLFYDENNVEAAMALFKIYKESGRVELAQEMWTRLKNYHLKPSQRTALDAIEGVSLNTFKATAKLEAGYDDNINLNPGSEILDDYTGRTDSEDTQGTLFSKAAAELSYIHELGEKGGWYLRSDLKSSYQYNTDALHYNLFFGGIDAGAGYAFKGMTLYLPLSYGFLHYLDRDLLTQIQIRPQLNYALSQKLIFNANMTYQKRDYLQARDRLQSDSSLGGGMGLYYLFGQNFAYMTLGYENYSAQEKGWKFIDKEMLRLTGGANYALTPSILGRLDYRLRYGMYEDTIATSNHPSDEKRSDLFQEVELKLSYYLLKSVESYLSDRYSFNRSNYKPVTYSKNIVMLGLGYSY